MRELLSLFMPVIPYAVGFIALVIFLKSFVIVGGTQIAVVERKYFGKGMPRAGSSRSETKWASRPGRWGPAFTC